MPPGDGVLGVLWAQVRVSLVGKVRTSPQESSLLSKHPAGLEPRRWVNLSVSEQPDSLSPTGVSVPYMCAWIISQDTYLWLDLWIPKSCIFYVWLTLFYFFPLKVICLLISWVILPIILFAFLWKPSIYPMVTFHSFPSLVSGQIFGFQPTDGISVPLLRLVWFGEGLESSAWKVHLFLQFN